MTTLQRLQAWLRDWNRYSEAQLLPGSRRAALKAILTASTPEPRPRNDLSGVLMDAIRPTEGAGWVEQARRNLALRGIDAELNRRSPHEG
jgi:hypothetical protein